MNVLKRTVGPVWHHFHYTSPISLDQRQTIANVNKHCQNQTRPKFTSQLQQQDYLPRAQYRLNRAHFSTTAPNPSENSSSFHSTPSNVSLSSYIHNHNPLMHISNQSIKHFLVPRPVQGPANNSPMATKGSTHPTPPFFPTHHLQTTSRHRLRIPLKRSSTHNNSPNTTGSNNKHTLRRKC